METTPTLSEKLLSPFDVNRATPTSPGTIESICKLIIHTNRGKMGGTGFFIHPRIVLTAGHCVIEHPGKAVNRVEVIPGLFDDSTPYGAISSNHYHVHPRYIKKTPLEWDFGFIILPAPVQINCLELAEDSIPNRFFKLSGYPADNHPTDELSSGRQISFENIRIESRKNLHMTFRGSYYPGQSGSPIFSQIGNRLTVSGIYSGSTPNLSFAVRVKQENVIEEFNNVVRSL